MNRVKQWVLILIFPLTGLAEVNVDKQKSLLITDHTVLNQVHYQSTLDFGYQIGRVSKMLDEIKPNRNITPGAFFEHIFSSAYQEQIDHKNSPAIQRIAENPYNNMYMNKIFDDWKSSEDLKAITDPSGLKGSPFRLLSIVNLMNRAGDLDDRGLPPNTIHPRSLGEIHLVYGYIDRNYEQTKSQPYPQTWVLSFRLPIIKKVNNQYRLDNRKTHEDLILNETLWKERMKYWAELWIELSEYGFQTNQYRNKLKKILSLAINPENFLNVRANTKVRWNEFELREWYILQKLRLIPRKPRREPYRCLDNSDLLKKIINHHWKSEYNDLDVTTHTITSGDQYADMKHGKNGYTIVRSYDRLGYQGNYSRCNPNSESRSPFDMNSRPNQVVEDEAPRLVAPFARVNPNTVWTVNNVSEPKRHAFAIRTCSGCHGKEGAAMGFHIFPRLYSQDSQVSAFMTGEAGNSFEHNGARYEYNELEDRKQWLIKALNGEAQLFDSLKVNHHRQN